jgi:Ser-tRNA(Ala) deacylase AlaX
MVPSLTVEIPNADADADERVHVKGAKTTGSVKVHNSFAGLDVD